MSGCIFCKIVAGDAPATIVQSWSDALAFTPLDPVALGHMLVVPVQHVANFITDPEVTMRTMARAAMLARAMGPSGHWNLITSKGQHATQTVQHFHVHLVPRHLGDGLALPWTGQSRDGVESNG